MWLILLIIIGFYAYNNNKTIENLRKENLNLKRKIKELSMQLENKATDRQNTENTAQAYSTTNAEKNQEELVVKKVENRPPPKQELTPEQKEQIRRERERLEKERKNTGILITGAILIVLAAIVFLMSAWTAIPDILKTLVIILLVGVFLGASKIAKDKFNLEKASATFFYIAMAYIPICLISCSLFGLFGGYFSIYGDGKFLFLTFTMILTSIIYFNNYKRRNSPGLLYASFISQISAVILFTFIFETDIRNVGINLLAYNIALMVLLRNKDLEQIPFIKNIYISIPYLVGGLSIFCLFEFEYVVQMIIILISLSVNLYILYLKNENKEFNSYLFNTSVYALGMYTIFSNANLKPNLSLIMASTYILVVFILLRLIFEKDKQFLKSSMITSIVAMSFIYMINYSYTIEYKEALYVKPYMIGIIEELLLIVAYLNSKEIGKKVTSILIPITFIMIGCNLIHEIKDVYYCYIILSIITFVIGEMIRYKDIKILSKGFYIVSHIFIGVVYTTCMIIYSNKFLDDVVYFMILLGIYTYSSLKDPKNILFKYLSYISGILTIYSSVKFLNLNNDVMLLIPVISAVGISLLETKYKNLKDDLSIIFITVVNIMSYCALTQIESEISKIVFTLLFSVYLYYNNIKNNDNELLKIIPLLGTIPVIFYNNLDETTSIIIKLLVVACLTGYSIYKNKISIDTIFSGIYLVFTINKFNSEYIREILLLVWSIAHYLFMNNDKEKDIFKGLSYIFGLILYTTFIKEFELDEYTAFSMIGITLTAMAFTRTIIIKYEKDIDTIEYILFSLIYLGALVNYNNEKDGMIFVFAIVCLVIFSYMKKMGSIFIISTLAIIVNALALTREFWFSIPWWIYLLLIGSILIAFAIKNESDGNKEKISVGKIIKKVKDNVEK